MDTGWPPFNRACLLSAMDCMISALVLIKTKCAGIDIYFYCRQRSEISRLVDAAAHSGESVEIPVYVDATVPDPGENPVVKIHPSLFT